MTKMRKYQLVNGYYHLYYRIYRHTDVSAVPVWNVIILLTTISFCRRVINIGYREITKRHTSRLLKMIEYNNKIFVFSLQFFAIYASTPPTTRRDANEGDWHGRRIRKSGDVTNCTCRRAFRSFVFFGFWYPLVKSLHAPQ